MFINSLGQATLFMSIFSSLFSGQVLATSLMPIQIKCWAGEYTEQGIYLKLVGGQIIQWDDNHVAGPKSSSLFGLFGEALSDQTIESFEFKADQKGNPSVKIVTSAESITVKVFFDLETGVFTGKYSYKDEGSGNGNSNLPLDCIKIIKLKRF